MSTESKEGLDDLTKVRERLSRAEWQNESLEDRITNRLNNGAETISHLRDSVSSIKGDVEEVHKKWEEAFKPRPVPMWKILGFAFSVLVFVSSMIWAAARYPDREEQEKNREEQVSRVEKLQEQLAEQRDKFSEMTTSQALIADSVKRQEDTQKQMADKVDQLVQAQVAQQAAREAAQAQSSRN